MFQKYQEYFKDHTIKIMLKYDGERTQNVYTVLIWDKGIQRSMFSVDTDEPFKYYNKFLHSIYTEAQSDENSDIIFKEFMNFKDKVVNTFGLPSILVFSVEMNPEIEFFISVKNPETRRFKTSSINEIRDFINELLTK